MLAPEMLDPQAIAALVDAARKGDRQAFAGLVGNFLPAVTATALSIVHSRDSAQDVAQLAFLRAWQSLRSLQASAAFATWLMTITRNCARNWLRDHSFQTRMARGVELTTQPAPTPTDNSLPPEVERLPVALREVVVLRYVSDLSYEEIAAATGQPLSVVRDRLYRAKLALQEILKSHQ